MPISNPPVGGPQVISGSYTGDGGNDRQITTGFKCGCVIIIRQDQAFLWVSNSVAMSYKQQGVSAAAVYTTNEDTVLLHATDGFIVDDGIDSVNVSAKIYHYWAISN